MAKCDCYFQHGRKFLCFGPMYREECPYGGNTYKCKFHQELRKLNALRKPELIDRRQIRYMWQEFRDGQLSDGVTLQSIIDRMPIVEAVKVIRCKDCEYTCPGTSGIVCTMWGAGTDPDGWCYKAERKNND